MEGTVESMVDQGVCTITFFHPSGNSLPGKLLLDLAEAIREAGVKKDSRVIVLRSGGDKAFCAGASFDELVAIKNLEEGKKFFSGFAAVINAMRKAPKFVLVRVQGKAVGGGVGLASAGDYTFATEAASVKLSELAVGIGPFVVGPAVERKIGTSAFMQMAINATQWYSSAWAKEKGLFAEVHPSVEEMDRSLNKLAQTLSESNPEAMAELKRASWEGTSHWDELLRARAGISGTLVLSDFTRKAIERFKSGVR